MECGICLHPKPMPNKSNAEVACNAHVHLDEALLLPLLPVMVETTDVVGVEHNPSQWFANASSFQLHQPTFNYNVSTSQPGSVPGPSTALSPSSANRSTRTQFPNESELYSRLLLLRRRGYPLWIPAPSQPIPEEFKKQGIRIGDV
ncbi:hypothetical protein GGU10DRAFT_56992 [Lentinula aff. detonsa]|uniref:Uncharacterized protein n=1 Tax=Lentinula aff. detonsa TaxID=2804958 RepID=A0AA38NKX5_9AGAR|nr:hypothetical protein GGU10DRAFT_56992 [Lentinula aff. detonsa]